MRRAAIVAAATATLLIALAGCSNDQAAPQPTVTKTVNATEKPADLGSFAACTNLLEDYYEDDNLHDASNEPECAGLSHDEYVKAAGGVLTGHKDDILADAEQHVAWDEAWEQTDPDQQDVMCRRLVADGPDVVGKEMRDAAGADSDGTEVDLAKYILAKKC